MIGYADGYLAGLVTPEREARALADVQMMGTFLSEWQERLQVIRVYILICLESTNSPEDAFAAKLALYKKEFDFVLLAAKAATAAAAEPPTIGIFGSIPMERG